MLLRSIFRFTFILLMLTACDDLPETDSSNKSLASVGPSSQQDVPVLSRPSPPLVMLDTISNTPIEVSYGAPSVRGRTIYGELVPYNELWRTGVNEATVVTFVDPMRVGETEVPPGKYALFTIPGKNKWTVILNTDYDQWGAYNYDEEKDILRLSVIPQFVEELQEQMQFSVDGQELILKWEYLRLPIPVKPSNS